MKEEKKSLQTKLNDVRAVNAKLNLLIDDLNCQLSDTAEINEPIATKEKHSFGPNVRKCLYKCLEAQVPVYKASSLLRFVAFQLCEKSLDVLPCPTTIAKAAFELGVLSDIQVAESLYSCETATLAWDSTSLVAGHFNEVHVAVCQPGSPNITVLALQIIVVI